MNINMIYHKASGFMNPQKRFMWLAHHGFYKSMSDEDYLRLYYKYTIGRELNLDDPKSFNEKLQWLKLYDRKDIYTTMVDKYEMKAYAAAIIGEEHLVETYGIWDSFDDIDFDALPNEFVLKCTHDAGGLIICKDKMNLDISAARKKIVKCLRRNYYYVGREWPYKNVKPRIMAERLLSDGSGNVLKDYKILCFGGEPRLIELHKGRFTSYQTQDIYDTEWHLTNITQNGLSHYGTSGKVEKRPETLDEMLLLSGKLSKGIPHLRCDWYSIGRLAYLGELTFYDGSGFTPYDKYEDDLMIGNWIELPVKDLETR